MTWVTGYPYRDRDACGRADTGIQLPTPCRPTAYELAHAARSLLLPPSMKGERYAKKYGAAS